MSSWRRAVIFERRSSSAGRRGFRAGADRPASARAGASYLSRAASNSRSSSHGRQFRRLQCHCGAVVAALRQIELRERDKRFRAGLQIDGLDQRLLVVGAERAHHRERVDERLRRAPRLCSPSRLQVSNIRRSCATLTSCFRGRPRRRRRPAQDPPRIRHIRPDTADTASDPYSSSTNAKPRHAGEGDEIAAVAGLGEARDPSGAADHDRAASASATVSSPGSGWIMPISRARGDRVVDHREIARLKNIERQFAARQQYARRQAGNSGRTFGNSSNVGIGMVQAHTCGERLSLRRRAAWTAVAVRSRPPCPSVPTPRKTE